jgi:hypothetical protein
VTVATFTYAQNVTIMQPFQRAKSFTLTQTYLYQKDERALPGNLQNRREKKMFLAPLPTPINVVSLATSPTFSLLSISLSYYERELSRRLVSAVRKLQGREE